MRWLFAILGALFATPAAAQLTGIVPVTVDYSHIYYVSKEASHGYAVGNDANACTSKTLPCLTIAHAVTLCATNFDAVMINPAATPYAETSGAGFLDIGNCALVTGEQALAGTDVTPATVPTLQAAVAANRVVNVPSKTFSQRLAAMILDGQSANTTTLITVNTNPSLYFQQIKLINGVAGQPLVGDASGTSAHTYDRLTIDTSNAATIWFNWHNNGSRFSSIRVFGGAFPQAATSRKFAFDGSTFASVGFFPDVNGNNPSFTGTTGAAPIRVASASSITNFSGTVTCVGTPGCYSIDGGGALTNTNISNSVFTNVVSSAPVTVINMSCNSFVLSNNSLSGGTTGMASIVAENCNGFASSNNNCAPASTTVWCYSWAPGTSMTSTNDTCTLTANLGVQPTGCANGSGDGVGTEASNTGAATGTQNLGDAAGNVFVAQTFTTGVANSSGRHTNLAYADVWVQKAGTPTGRNFSMCLQADNAGVPSGTCLASSQSIDAATIPSSSTRYHMQFTSPPAVTAATKYYIVFTLSGAPDAVNFVKLDVNLTVTIGSLFTGTSVPAWTNDATHAVRTLITNGFYNLTPTYVGLTCNYSSGADTHEYECLNSGAVNGINISQMKCTNCGYGMVIKNALGTTTIFNNLHTSFGASNFNAAVYSKASINVNVWNTDCIIGGSGTGSCFLIENDGLSVQNPIVSSNPRIKNSIISTVSTATPYGLAANTTGSVDINFNNVNAVGTTINAIGSQTWGTWQAAGRDTSSQGPASNPQLANQTNPTTFAELLPNAASPVCGTGTTGQPSATDALGVAWKSPPAIGAVECP